MATQLRAEIADVKAKIAEAEGNGRSEENLVYLASLNNNLASLNNRLSKFEERELKYQGTIGPSAGDGALYSSQGKVIYDFWCAVVKPNGVALDKTGKKLKFTDGVTRWGWKRDVEELYVRECYKSAVDTLRDTDMAMLEGTPGIGKRLFIFYLIYVIVSEAFEKGENVPTFVIGDRDGRRFLLSVDSDGNGVVEIPTTQTPHYFITDTVGSCQPSFIRQYFHVTGFNDVNWKYVNKLLETPPVNKKPRQTIWFPVFSLQEYFEADNEGDQTAMRFYYDVFGGSLRNLRLADWMMEDAVCHENIYEIVQAEMSSFFGGYELAGISEATWKKTAKALIRKLRTADEGMSGSVLFHWAPTAKDSLGWAYTPASRFMRHLAGYICSTCESNALYRLKDEIEPLGMSFVHAHDAHTFRLANLGKAPGITLWSLLNEPARTLCLPIRRVVRISTVDDIECLEDGDYGLPTDSNFPFLDAVMKPNYIFQDTVAKSRHPSEAKIPEILRALKKTADIGPIVLVNTVATDDFDEFKMNGSDVFKPFSQWKTRMEAHNDDETVVNKLTAKASEVSKGGKRKRANITAKSMPKGKKSKK